MKRPKDRLHRVAVIGATPAGIAAANKLGEMGIPVTLVDSEPNLDSKLAQKQWTLASGLPLNHAHRPGLIRILRNPGIKLVLPARVNSIKHNNQGFRIKITQYPTYIDGEQCTLCGRCVEVCPISAGENKKAVNFENRLMLPGRPFIDKRRLPLCRENCPLGVNVQGYIALTKEGRFSEAISLIRERNVLPAICGRICTHPCETNCRRGDLDDAVSIKNIKRFLADHTSEKTDAFNDRITAQSAEKRDEKIAVIGSGPAGLAAAAELARYGCQATIYEKEESAGGLLRYGIGPHRLPRDILDAEIENIKKLGVDIVTSHSVDLKKDLPKMTKTHHAVIICSGTWKDRKLNVPGEDLEGVEGCLSFLNAFYTGEIKRLKKSVAVIGDGNAAYDLARTLSRIGADVTIVSWFSEDQIPADPDEIKAAEDEGISLIDKTQVVGFKGNKGVFNHLICQPTEAGSPDEDGIAWPVIIKGSKTFDLAFDRAFVAIGQTGSLKESKTKKGLNVNSSGFITRTETMETNIPNVYVAGDACTGPSSVVHAMADGSITAATILRNICGIRIPEMGVGRPKDKEFPEIPSDIPSQARAKMPERQPANRTNNFTEVELGLPESQAIYEAQRCLQCGVCSDCLQCLEVCKANNAIHHDAREEEIIEQAGVVILADPTLGPQVKGDDVVRAYGPKSSGIDVNAMFIRGFSAAAKAMVLLGNTAPNLKGGGLSFTQPEPELSKDIRIGVYICRCNDSVGWMDELDRYLDGLRDQEDIVHCQTMPSACVSDGITTILKSIREKGITRIVLGSCVCCPLDFVCSACTDQRSRLKAGLFKATGISRSMVATANIRGEALSQIEKNPEWARNRFEGIISRSIRHVRRALQFPSPVRAYNFTTAVIGESESVIASARTLADSDMDVYVYEASKKHFEGENHPNIYCFEGSRIKDLSGTLGDFQLTVQSNGFEQKIQVGAVIMGEKSRKQIKYIHQEGLPSRTVAYATQKKGKTGVPFFYPGMTSISGLFLADPPGIRVSNRIKGAAAAILAATVMPRGPRQSKGYTVVVDRNLCRGCGRCVDVCPYQAIMLQKNEVDGWHASVDESFCKGCGNCISVCPSNAADSPFRSQSFLERSLEEILLQ